MPFQHKYLADGAGEAAHPAQAVYERSLSSLLFLSMGIFLLNSVNELVDGGNLPNAGAGQARCVAKIIFMISQKYLFASENIFINSSI